MYQYFRANEAVVSHCGAMESETIQKNGVSPKNQRSRIYIKAFAFSILVAGIIGIKACNKDTTEQKVPQNVIDLVSEPEVFPEAKEWARIEEIVPEKERSWNEPSNEDPRIKRTSQGLDECFAFNTTWNCKTIKISASQNPDDFAMFNPLASVLWPGNLVQGESLASGIPTSIPITKRQPGKISLAIVSSGSGGASMDRTVDKMQFSNVNQAMNEILSGFGGHGYAQYNFEMDFIQSEEELNFKLNASFKGWGASASAGFSHSSSDGKQRILIRLSQSYFTMVYDDPAGLDGVFTPDITVNDLRNYTGNGNPICYISSVTYGRVFYLLYESTASRSELEAALNFSYKGFGASVDVDAELEFKETMQKTTARVRQLGGGADGGITAGMALNLNEIRDFLEKGINFDAQNPGAPISYTVKYLKNAKLVRMNNAMEYEVEQCTSEVTETKCPELPELTTDAAMNITARTAMLGGNITNAGWPEYAERGVVYSSTIIPEIGKEDSEKRISIGMGTGSFTVTVSGLTPLKEYYVRAYATNTEGTVYGAPVSFTTNKATPTLTTNAVTTFTAKTATLGGTISFVGEPHYTERGVVYSSTGIPTTATGQKAPNIGNGEGSFNVNVSGLTPLTEYYARAYAINDEGTAYGDPSVSFTTPAALPVVSIGEPDNITTNSARVSGIITDAGKPEYTERGFCYNTTGNPEITGIGNTKIPVSSTSEFFYNFTGLSENITYHVRAYAISTAGTSYSDEVRFTTGTTLTLSTLEPSEIKATSAKLGVDITNAGNPPYTEIGVCIATTPNPTTDNKREIAGNKEGKFYTTVTGLAVNTRYYVRAYGINSEGTIFGKEVFFTTTNGLPDVTTNPVTSYTATTAILGGNIIDAGTPSYTERGVVYATTPRPTTANTKKIIAGTGQTGVFSERITDLLPNIRYYVRAYAINTVGTAYGEEDWSFTTENVPMLTTTDASNITPTTVRLGGVITNAGVPPNTERGVVYATTQNPTIANTKKESTYTGITGAFTVDVYDLDPDVMYYVRAYVMNDEGTYYGDQKSFETSNEYYLDDKGVIQTRPSSAVKVTTTTNFAGGWYYVPKGERMTITSRRTVTGSVNLILEDGCVLTITGGINVTGAHSLTIYGQSSGTGSLIATATGLGNAGIGGNAGQSASTITINGGAITATGGNGTQGGDGTRTTFLGATTSWTGGNGGRGAGAGIGGGGGAGGVGWNQSGAYCTNGSEGGGGGTITIDGGTITAKGGARGNGGGHVQHGGSGGGGGGQGAGIGGGGGGGGGAAGGGANTQAGASGQLVVSGKGGDGGNANGAGGGAGGSGANVKINGGKVTANDVVIR